jgi:tRNA-2-methylthio-N6-dimethylallyladenosine synthase
MVGQTFRVLVDSASRRRAWELAGRTVGNTVVNFPGGPELIGQEVDITITASAPNSVRGELAGALC